MARSRSIPVLKITDSRAAEAVLADGDDYVDWLTMTYFRNLLKNTDVKSPVAYKICGAFESNQSYLFEEIASFPQGKVKGAKKDDKVYDVKKASSRRGANPKDWETLIAYFDSHIKKFGPVEPTPVYMNIERMGKDLGFDDLTIDTLKFLHTAQGEFIISSFSEDMIGTTKTKASAMIARFIDRPEDVGAITQILDPSSPLISYGIVYADPLEDNFDPAPFHQIYPNILSFIGMPDISQSSLVEKLIGKPSVSELTADDFSYLSEDVAQIRKVISDAMEEGKSGINILLYGPSGSGKTALAKAIAHSLDLQLFAVGEEQESQEDFGNQKPTATQRMGKLFQSQAFLKGNKKAILLFDEVEDLLLKGTDADKKAEPPSKIIINRLLENNPVVTIWGGNDPEKFHESMRQRFSYSVHVDYQPTKMRIKIWERQLRLKDREMAPGDLTYFARHYMAPPRMIANAVGLSGKPKTKIDRAEVERILLASSRITYGDSQTIRSRGGVSEKFDPSLFNYEQRHQNEVQTLIASGPGVRPFALLLNGPAGCGMTNFGRYLAEEAMLNQAEHDMRAILAPHPLLSPESKLTKAFEEAHDGKQLLVFSNIEALSSNPQSNAADWKHGLAPLFMKHMLEHRLPVLSHTYNSDVKFPSFIQDGFSLAMKVDALTPAQCRQAYELYFGKDHPVEDLEKIAFPANLVPADFAAVDKILAKTTNGKTMQDRLIGLLKQQAENRAMNHGRYGF